MIARLSLLALLVAAPAIAQPPAAERVLTIFGSDKCPAGYICVRANESERYRIPKTIRDNTPSQTTNSQRNLAASTAAVSATGTGSCTAVGGGGWTGCWKKEMDAARAERQAEAEAAPRAPQG